MKKTLKLAIVALFFAVLPTLALALVTVVPTAAVVSFNPVAVGVSAGSAQTLTATFAVSGYTGSFTPTATLHYGNDYSAGAVNCTASGGGENCSVTITFQPTLPGGRKDALFLMNGSTRLATVLLGGVGQAPLGLMQPGVVTNINPGATYDQYNSAVDENGTVYVLSGNSASGSNVFSITKAGVVTTLPVTATGPWGIAIDGAGVLYIAQNTYSHTLITYDTVLGVQGSLCVAPPALGMSCGSAVNNEYMIDVAVDPFGNIFTTEILSNTVFELKPDGSYVTTAISPTITQPYQIAVDSADNVYVGGYQINKLTSGGTQTQVNPNGASDGLAVDAADSLYATRYTTGPGSQGVALLPASDYTTFSAAFDPTASPLGLSLGSDGTLYVGNYSNTDKVDRSQGLVAFGEVNPTGTPTATQYVSVYNGGNENLTLSSYALTGDSEFALKTATSNPCTDGLVLTPGELCQVGVNATSTHGGTYSGAITFITNSLNTTTTQTVALTAFSYNAYMVPSPTVLTFGTQNTGTASTAQIVTLTNNGYFYNGSVGAATVPSSAFSVTVPSACNSVAMGASCQVSVTFKPTAAQSYSGTVTMPVSSSGGGSIPSVTFTVSGTGVNPAPVASLSPALSFPNTNAGSTATALVATLSNTGSATLTGITPSITGTNPGDFAVTTGSNACGSSLAANTTCSIYVTFTPAGGSSYSATLSVLDNAASSPQTITLTGTGVLNTQTINFTQPTSPVTYSSGLTVALVATGGASGNPVVFTLDASSTGAGTISGSTLTVTGAGTFVIDANQAGNSNYAAATQVQRTVQVQQAAQTINFTQPTTPVTYTSGLTVSLVATGGASGNPVVFTLDASSTGAGTISGTTLTVTGAGTFVIDANQAGNTNYAAATQVQRTVQVLQAAQTINFTQPATPVTYSSGLTVALVATGGASGNPVVFTLDASSTGAGTISGTTLTVTKTGSFVIDSNQAGSSNYAAATQVQRTVQVQQAAQTINFTQPTTPVTYTSGLTVALVATGGASGNPVVFTLDASSTGAGTISGTTLTVTKTGSFVIDANQAGSSNYAAATQVQRTVQVQQVAQTINFTQPATPVTYTSGLTVALVATGGASGNPVVFTLDASSTGAGTISGTTLAVTGAGTFVIDANQAGGTNYAAATQVQRTVQVQQAAQTAQAINFTQPTAPATYSSGITVSLSATGGASGNPVVFTLDASSTGAGTISGSTLTVTGAGTFVIDANQAGNSSYAAAPQVQQTIVIQGVQSVPPDFSITPSPVSQSVTAGGNAVFTITAASTIGSFTTPIQLSVSGLPTGATAAFSPASITLGGELPNASTLTVTTATQTASNKPSPGVWPIGAPALALLVLIPMRRWRRVWRGKLLIFLAAFLTLAASLSLTACGGGFGFPTTSHSYTLTITGSGGTATHTATVQLTVQE